MQKLLRWSSWIKGRIPADVQRWEREHYIPLKPYELINKLIERAELKSAESDGQADLSIQTERLRLLAKSIVDIIHRQYRAHHEQLIRLYDAFDPDVDVRAISPVSPLANAESREASCRRLFSEISDSLDLANYRRLKPSEIQETLNAASHWGVRLKIRFSSFRRLEVYGRGDIVTKRLKRDWRRMFRWQECDVPIYQRLFVLFRTKELQSFPELLDPECIHIRMFKNIPKLDVDMMLPGSQIQLSWTDTSKIGIPTLWGLFMLASKLVKSFWLLALLGAFKIVSSFVLIVAIAVASAVYAIKSVLSYSTTKRRYQLDLARNLYYQNLANNLGALLRLVDEAEQQEACEGILAFYVLHQDTREVLTTEEMDQSAEDLLRSLVGTDVDFDAENAIRDLLAIGLIENQSEGWRALAVEEAIQKIAAR